MAGQGKQGAKGKGGNPGAKQDADAKVKREPRTVKKAAGKAAAAKTGAAAKKATKRVVKKPVAKAAKPAVKKPAKKVAKKTAKSVARKAAKKSAAGTPAKKKARRISKPASKKTVKLGGKAVNLGPERGDNSFPPSNKGNAGFSQAHGPAADSTSGPGGMAFRGGNKGEKGGGVGKAA